MKEQWTPMNVAIAIVTGILLLRVGLFVLSLALGILWNLLILTITLGCVCFAWVSLQHFMKK